MALLRYATDGLKSIFAAKTERAILVGLSWGRGQGGKVKPSFIYQAERYRAHPNVRYGIDTFTTSAAGGGFHFISHTEEEATEETMSEEEPVDDKDDSSLPITEAIPPGAGKRRGGNQRPDDERAQRHGSDNLPDRGAGLEAPKVSPERIREAIEKLESWCEDTDFDTWNLDSTRDLWGYGNIFAEKQYEAGKFVRLVRVPTPTIESLQITGRGQVLRLIQNIKGSKVVFEKETLEKILHINWNPFDTGIIGRGVLDSLCVEGPGYSYYTSDDTLIEEKRPAYGEIMEENEDMMRKGIHRTTPRFMYVLYGIPKDSGESLVNEIKKLRPEDDVIMTVPRTGKDLQPSKVEVQRISHESRTNIDPQIQYFVDGVLQGIQSPDTRIAFSNKPVTEASSRTIERFRNQDVGAFQRYQRRKYERLIFKEVLLQEGFSEEEIKMMKIRMRFPPVTKVEITPDFMLKSFQANGLGRNEFREYLSSAGVPLSPNPEYQGIQGGATKTYGEEVRPSASSGLEGQYEKGPKGPDLDEGEDEN